MKIELQNQLAQEFPFMIARNVWTGDICYDDDGSTYGFPCECSNGWYDIIHDCCQELNELYVATGVDINEIVVMQIKEKFGGLRFYTGGLIEGGNEIVDKYEAKSYATCEICGKPGELAAKGGWLQTLCDEHISEHGFKKSAKREII